MSSRPPGQLNLRQASKCRRPGIGQLPMHGSCHSFFSGRTLLLANSCLFNNGSVFRHFAFYELFELFWGQRCRG